MICFYSYTAFTSEEMRFSGRLIIANHIEPSHVAEAVNYRNLDREGWAG